MTDPKSSGVSRFRLFRRASSIVQRHDRVGDAVGGAVIKAADRAAKVNHAERLTALQNGQADQRPPIGEAARPRGFAVKIRQTVNIVEVEDMGAVEIRRSVTVTEIERVIAVVEQPQRALLVQGMGVGIGRTHLESMAHALLHMHLQGVVRRNAGCFIGDGLGGIPDIRNSQIEVAALKVSALSCRLPG